MQGKNGLILNCLCVFGLLSDWPARKPSFLSLLSNNTMMQLDPVAVITQEQSTVVTEFDIGK